MPGTPYGNSRLGSEPRRLLWWLRGRADG